MTARPSLVKRPKIEASSDDQLPPGQHLTRRWPVFHHGAIPPFDPRTWELQVVGLVARPLRLTWPEVSALPRVSVRGEMHCVTRWSTVANDWEGIAARQIVDLAGVEPSARFVLLHADGGYTANLPLAAFVADDVLLALRHGGTDLSLEHGAPLRAVVPARYAWKSVKWLRAIEFLADDQSGFWERYGYHPDGDPWREQRFADESAPPPPALPQLPPNSDSVRE